MVEVKALLIFLAFLPQTKSIGVYKSSFEKERSGLKYLKPDNQSQPSGTSITACNRSWFKCHPGGIFWIGNDHKDATMPFMLMYTHYPFSWWAIGSFERGEGAYRVWILKNPENQEFTYWKTHFWHHSCIAYEKEKRKVTLVIDGVVFLESENVVDAVLPADFYDSIWPSDCRCKTMVSDFNIWNKALTTQELIDWTTCKNTEKGDTIDWNTAEWIVRNMTKVEMSYDDICQPKELGLTTFPKMVNVTTARQLCKSMRGKIPFINNATQEKQILGVNANYTDCLSRVWIDLSDENHEGTFSSMENSSLVLTNSSYSNWALSEPNGDVIENCVTYIGSGWNDIPCDFTACTVCDIDTFPIFAMRGLCYGSKFDTDFSWTGDVNETSRFYSFNGFTSSDISWNDTRQEWVMTKEGAPNIYATCNETGPLHYPLGAYNWYFFNDTCPRAGKGELVAKDVYRFLVTLSACKNDKEFACRNGQCINLEQLCDGQIDCSDRTDEMDCKLIRIDSSYSNKVAPQHETLPLLPVNLEAGIQSILDIDEIGSIIQLQIVLKLSWFDDRLRFANLKKTDNILNSHHKNVLWFPSLKFLNTKDELTESFKGNDSLGTVLLMGKMKGERTPKHVMRNEIIYRGKDSEISIMKFFLVDFICQFQMSNYPFDNQVCKVKLGPNTMDEGLIKFVMRNLSYNGPSDIKQYLLSRIEHVEEGEGLTIKIYLGRRVMDVMLKTILPTIMIIIVTFSTNLYGDHFDAIVTVNLTALLVMVTLYLSITENLPATSYLKMMDYWLIFSLFIPFVEVMLHTLLAFMRNKIDAAGEDDFKPDLVQKINNEVMVKVAFVDKKKKTNWKKLALKYAQFVLEFGLPSLFLFFMFGFFMMGAIVVDIVPE